MSSTRKFRIASGALLLAAAAAAHGEDAAQVRSELEALKAQYAAQIQALEQRLQRLEAAQAAAPQPAPAPAPMPAPAAAASGTTGGGSMTAYNPAMSVILSGTYADLSRDPQAFHIAGFFPSGDEIGPGSRGFSLGESELTLTANIDPYFSGAMTAAITGEDEIGIEEAFVRTSALPEGFTAKVGRFFSGLGYLNEIHAHAWDFVDQPLAYQAFLGGQLPQNGLQVKWLAPTDLFVEVGAETGSGERFPGTRLNRNAPNGAVAFVHAGSDIGDSASWRAGVSFLRQRAQDRSYDSTDAFGTPVVDAFSGTSRLWVGDFVWKWAPQGNPTQRYLKIQGEYLYRRERGTLAFDLDASNLSDGYSAKQSGAYLQGVYQFRRRWRVGARYDWLDTADSAIGLVDRGLLSPAAFPELLSATPTRATLMLDWSPSEFSRLRAQYALDDAGDSRRDRQLFLQYLYSLGAHGAHKY